MKTIKKIQYYFPNLLFIAIVMGLLLIILSSTSYLDIFNLCYINIDGDLTRGNEKTIKQAIRLIRENDQQSYKTLCRHVNAVKERYCLIPEVPIRFGKEPGCYIRGSRVIYLIPEKVENEQVIRQRSEIIKKYAQKSKNFWNENH